jgi:hypothetical protein
MPPLPAFEAHLKPALTVHSVPPPPLCHEPVAVGPRAPLVTRVRAYIDILLKLQILLIYLLRTELSNILSRIFSGASCVCTFNLNHLSISDVEGDVVGHAVQAETVGAELDSMEILLSIVVVADIAGFTTIL